MSHQNFEIRIFGAPKELSDSIVKEKHVLHNEEANIQLSVAIPCYNGNKIAWLCMEGLCNQVNVNFDWEIVVCEELHENVIGKDFFMQYIQRLINVGCKKITYIELINWVNLPEKWKIIGRNIDDNSNIFILQAVDCYPPKERLSITHKLINDFDYDWIDFGKGYFYSFNDDKLIQYNANALTNLHMGLKSIYAKQFRSHNRNTGIDGFLFNTIKSINPNMKRFTYNELLSDGIDTDGYNNISKRRSTYYNSVKFPFIETNKKLNEIGLPEYIIDNIKKMRIDE